MGRKGSGVWQDGKKLGLRGSTKKLKIKLEKGVIFLIWEEEKI